MTLADSSRQPTAGTATRARSNSEFLSILARLGQRGFASYSVDYLVRGRELVAHREFEFVISLENPADGKGYHLIKPVIARMGSLFVGLEVPHGRLWLPVVDHGEKVFGNAAVSTAPMPIPRV